MADLLHVDIETYSSQDLKKVGLYKYIASEDFEILLIAYAINNGSIRVVDVKNDMVPMEFIELMSDPEIVKCAHNAVFERLAFNACGFKTDISEWFCTMVKASYCGLPASLDQLSKVLDLQDKGKLSQGRALIRYFCKPCKPTKVNEGRTRNLSEHAPEKWEAFKQYCANDVEAEREVHRITEVYEIPCFERELYCLDQEINDNGILIDALFVQNALNIDSQFANNILDKAKKLTGLDNPSSIAQLKKWVEDSEEGLEIQSLNKETVTDLLDTVKNPKVYKALQYRQLLGKSSTKKYQAMVNTIGWDSRARGLFQFYGANRTGRWAGRLIQLQNLPRNYIEPLTLIREIVKSGDLESLQLMFSNVSNVLSELIRTSFIAPKDKMFIVCDFSSIEARVLAWLSGETWRLDVFNSHGKIYEASAASMFNVPIGEVTKGSDLRYKGKIAELALGYQGAVGAMTQMGADKMGLSEQEMKTIVTKWRKSNPNIVSFWKKIELTAIKTIKTRKAQWLGDLVFEYDGFYMTIKLPSGRKLFYSNPKLKTNTYNKLSISYYGVKQQSKQWGLVDTYGGKLTENIVQAISRDILAVAMTELNERLNSEEQIVMHVHDEVVIESPLVSQNRLDEVCEIMSSPINWAAGLPLKVDGYITPYYKKD